MFDLTGKTALVTGSTQGIGFEIASLLSKQGAKVFVSGAESIEKCINACNKIPNSVPVRANLLKTDDIDKLYEETGAIEVEIEPICLYSISSYGLLCFANIKKFEKLPNFEMEEIGLFEDEPNNLTYPDTYHLFFNTVKEKKKSK